MPVNASSTAPARPPHRAGPPKRGRPRATLRGELNEVYRRAILDAAERVFGERGFGAAKMTEVARAAGLAAGTLYNYFDSKDQIFRALVEHRGEEFMTRMETLAAKPGRLPEILVRLVRAAFEHFEAHRTMFAVFAELGANVEWSLRQSACAKDCHDRYIRLFEAVFRRASAQGATKRDLPARDVATLLTGSMHGLLRTWMIGKRKGRITDRANLVVDVFLHGIGKTQ